MDANFAFLPHRISHTARSGVSLLELLLALALTSVVMGLISMAISLNFRMYDAKRSNIEEAQLARSVLRHIADDIRAAVQHMPPDLSGLETVMGNSQNANSALASAGLGGLTGAAAGQAGGQGGGQGGQGGQAGNQASGAQTGQQSGDQNNGNTGGTGGNGGGGSNTGNGNSLPVTSSGTMGGVDAQTQEAGSIYGDQQSSNVVGLYGSSTELQIDISRLPRVDQFQAQVDETNSMGVVDIPSDMKTVTYFLRPEEGLTEVGTDGHGRGLMRRVLDRAVADFEGSGGGVSSSLGELELLAEEVVGLQFMYFDGASWTSEWDSAAMEGLPVAIEITLALQSAAEQQAAKTSTASATTTEEETERYYTLTVNLPTATSYDEKQQAAAAAEEETALSQSGAIDTSGDAAAAGAGAGGMGAAGFPGAGGGGPGGGGGNSGGGRGDQGGNGPRGGGGGQGGGQGGFGGNGGFPGGGQGGMGGSGPRGGGAGGGQGGGGRGGMGGTRGGGGGGGGGGMGGFGGGGAGGFGGGMGGGGGRGR